MWLLDTSICQHVVTRHIVMSSCGLYDLSLIKIKYFFYTLVDTCLYIHIIMFLSFSTFTLIINYIIVLRQSKKETPLKRSDPQVASTLEISKKEVVALRQERELMQDDLSKMSLSDAPSKPLAPVRQPKVTHGVIDTYDDMFNII